MTGKMEIFVICLCDTDLARVPVDRERLACESDYLVIDREEGEKKRKERRDER